MPRFSAFLLLFLALASGVAAQSLPAAARGYLGDWTIVSDETGEAQAVVRISEVNGKVEGRIVRVLPTEEYPTPNFTCEDCKGQYNGMDLRRIRLIRDMEWQGDEFAGGRIVDPENDKSYRATMQLEGRDRLRVRGFIGIRALGRTQVWRRAR